MSENESMYNFINGLVRKNGEWVFKDISNESLTRIISNYGSARAIVTWGIDGKKVEIRFDDLTDILSTTDMNQTLSTWLHSYVTNEIPTYEHVTNLADAGCVIFRDLHKYNLTPTLGSHEYAQGLDVPKGLLTDLMLSDDLPEFNEKSVASLGKNALLCIDGRILDTRYVHGKLFGLDAVQEIGKGCSPTFSIVDFTDVGGREIVRMTDDNMRIVDRTPLEEESGISHVVVTLPFSLKEKTPFVVLDGVLRYSKEHIRVLSDRQVVVRVNHQHALTRAAKSNPVKRKWVSPANVNKNGLNLPSFDLSEFLKFSGSFIVLVNTTELNIREEQVSNTNTPRSYRHYRVPKGLVMNEVGELMPYLVDGINEEQISFSVLDNERRHLMTESVSVKETVNHSRVVQTQRTYLPYELKVVDMYVI